MRYRKGGNNNILPNNNRHENLEHFHSGMYDVYNEYL